MLRGNFEITAEGTQITLPDIIRSQINGLWGDQEIILLYCPIFDGAYQITLHPTAPKKINSSCMVGQIDAKGRIVLPKSLVNMLKEEGSGTVVLIGLLDRFEIWIPWKLEEAERKDEEENAEERAMFDAFVAELNNEAK